jgi:hypothetical protein
MTLAALLIPFAVILPVMAESPERVDIDALPATCLEPFAERFAVDDSLPGRVHARMHRGDRTGWLEITLDARGPDAQARLERYYNSALGLGDPVSYSGLPLGNAVYSSPGAGTRIIRTHDGRRIVQVAISYFAKRTGSGYTWRHHDPDGDEERVEGIARYLTARAAYRATSAGTSVTLAGRQVATRRVGDRPERWVAIQDWARAKGATLTVNERRGTAQLTLNGTAVIVPLGSRRIKAGAKWIDLPAPVAWWDSGWYVPLVRLP